MEAIELEEVLADYSRISSANKAKFAKLRVILQQFHDNGIDCILLKGADLIPRLYGVLGVRPLGDADLLVHESDLPAIDHLLTQWGYRHQIDGNPAYVDPDNILALDHHKSVVVNDQDSIWQRAVQRDFDGILVKGMGGGDLLVYLTAYTVVHRGFLSASFAHDIVLLVEKEDVDGEFLIDEASRRHLKIPIYHGLPFELTRYAGAPFRIMSYRTLLP